MVGTAVAAGSWDTVRDARLLSITDPVDAAGGSLAVYTDVPQPERDVTCTATPPQDDAEPIEVPEAPLDLTAVSDGSTWTLIGFLLEGEDGLTVACEPADEAGDSASYVAAVAEGVQQRANLGNGIGWTAVLLGIVLATLVALSRRNARRESTS